MAEISAVVVTFNEEEHIEQCINSLKKVADEIIVVDSFSTDRTPEICGRTGIKFFSHGFEGYAEQKNYALSLASYPLVLSLDGDEVLSDELIKSIIAIKENPVKDGYLFNRRHNYCGKWLNYSRWYPDRQLRLFYTDKGHWVGPNPHDKVVLKSGSVKGWLKGDILHWNYSSYENHIEKINKFSSIAAIEYFKAGKKVWFLEPRLHSLWSFFRSYILNFGFLDGYDGYMCCSITAYASFLKYSKLRKLNSEKKKVS